MNLKSFQYLQLSKACLSVFLCRLFRQLLSSSCFDQCFFLTLGKHLNMHYTERFVFGKSSFEPGLLKDPVGSSSGHVTPWACCKGWSLVTAACTVSWGLLAQPLPRDSGAAWLKRPGFHQVKLTNAAIRIPLSPPPLLVTYWQFAMAPLVSSKHSTYTGIRQRLGRFYEFTMFTVRKPSSPVQEREKQGTAGKIWDTVKSLFYICVPQWFYKF